MSLEKKIPEITFTQEEEEKLRKYIDSDAFIARAKSKIQSAAEIYNSSEEKIKQITLRFPRFASLDHKRVVRDAVNVYGDEDRVKKSILRFPPFAGLDHKRVVRDAVSVYGDEDRVKKAILGFPQFAG